MDGTRWRCEVDDDCGAGWVCRTDGGGSGFCVAVGDLVGGDGDSGLGDTGEVDVAADTDAAGPVTDSGAGTDTGPAPDDVDTGPAPDDADAGLPDDADAGLPDVPTDAGGVPDVPDVGEDSGAPEDTDTGGDPCALPCDDDNPCTADGCDPVTGCTHTPAVGDCDDGDPCTVADACEGGLCQPGGPVDCDDGDPCTDDSCTTGVGCVNAPRENGAPCGGGQICVDGSCQPPCGPREVLDGDLGACVASSVSIPSESFWMGCKPGTDEPCQDDERPYHEVVLDAYLVDATEVTAAQYEACVADGACAAVTDGDCGTGSTTYGKPGLTQHPVTCVTWQRADTYCAWAGKALCTEAQWERAARGGCEKYPGEVCADVMPRYPWGDSEPTCGVHAVFADGGGGCGTGGTYPVTEGSPEGQSPYGVWDLGGNVWEWVADWYAGDYYCEGPDAICKDVCGDCAGKAPHEVPWSNPEGPPGGAGFQKIIRGSGYNQGEGSLRTGNRGLFPAGQGSPEVGFRCCAAP